MWRVTLPAFGVLLLAWFFGNFVLAWFQHNDLKPQTQHGERPSGASDTPDQSCLCHVSDPARVLDRHQDQDPVYTVQFMSVMCALNTGTRQFPFRKSSSIFYWHLNFTSPRASVRACVYVMLARSKSHDCFLSSVYCLNENSPYINLNVT